MLLKEATEQFLNAFRHAVESKDTDLIRKACDRFLVAGWIVFSYKSSDNELYSKCNTGDVENLAREYLNLYKYEKNTIWGAGTELEQLAVLRATDALAKALPFTEDSGYINFGVEFGSLLYIRKVKLDTDDQVFGNEFNLIRRPRPLSPAYNQDDPIVVAMRNHYVAPSRIKEIKFTWGGIISRVGDKTESEKENIARPVIVYVGGYDTSRKWEETYPDSNNGEMLFFSEAGGIDADSRFEELKNHIKAAVKAEANIVVLPELTITPSIRGKLAGWCSDNDFPKDMFIIPGTYHVRDRNKGCRNRCSPMGGGGHSAAPQDKITAFKTKNKKERINEEEQPTEIINYLYGDEIINILICADFCDGGPANLPSIVPGTLVLVPSMGDDSTIGLHISKCKMSKKFNEPAVVIAQEMLKAPDCKGDDPPSWLCVFDGTKSEPCDSAVRQLSLIETIR